MFVRNSTWKRIRDQFAEEEKAALRAAVSFETICPPGLHISRESVTPALLAKLEAEIARAEPGA